MKKIIPLIFSAFLTISFSILSTDIAYAKPEQENAAEEGTNQGSENKAYVSGLTSGRGRSLIGGIFGLMSVVVGLSVKRRSVVDTVKGRSWAITALVLGLAAFALSIFHLANTTGGFGTGGGRAGAIVALVLGIIGTVVSGVTLRPGPK